VPNDSRPVALDFDQFEVITFDCYGTLIDWESGILAAIDAVAARHSLRIDPQEILALYSRLEPEAQAGSYKSYRDVLRSVMHGIGDSLGAKFDAVEEGSLAASLPSWKPFDDTVAALRRLKSKYRLGIISNIDDDLFTQTARSLEVPFDYVVTAQQVGSYKPSKRNFEKAIARIGLPREKILHVAESVYHDVIPAKSLGLSTAWVNRRMGKVGSGATRNVVGSPDIVVPDLKTLAGMAV
jgi:2-haloacid dehalogenase